MSLDPGKYWHFLGLGPDDLPPRKFDSPVGLYERLRSKVPFYPKLPPASAEVT